ncbi:MAG TPA: DUF5684 domain-containing protein [Polyangiaceae bacterium]|jgi:hypothetical protein|nr:DUF5684 domain-containing protein [Polyangiaceae bacterium]
MIGFLFKLTFGLIGLIVGLAGLIGGWKTFKKADRPGLFFIIPILNVITMVQIAGKPLWWLILLLIPGVNLIVMLLVFMALARSFGRGALFGFGLLLVAPLFWFLLGFSDVRYLGPAR